MYSLKLIFLLNLTIIVVLGSKPFDPNSYIYTNPATKKQIVRCIKNYYHNSKTNSCQPKCENGCKGGNCIMKNKCQCTPPLILHNNNECIEPPPKCDKPCINANCTARNTCTCLEGYEHVDEFKCTPKCKTCNNGTCVAPDLCDCFVGYTKNNESECVPDCNNCENGKCTAPLTCDCNDGYGKSEDGKCKPICDHGCANGTCIAPNKCKCFDGYSNKTIDNSICERDEPSCENCDNGRCVSSTVCFCNEHYVMVNGSCTPTCWKPCVNGRCVAPNECECFNGYIKNETDPMSCYKTCACDNGVCKDGQCVCDLGFDLVNDTCVEVKPVDCNTCNGHCLDKACWCEDQRPCYEVETSAEDSSALRLASIEMGWLLGGCVGILLVSAMVITIGHMWRKRRDHGTETLANGVNKNSNQWNGSVLFTAPDTLKSRKLSIEYDNANIDEDDEDAERDPLAPGVVIDRL